MSTPVFLRDLLVQERPRFRKVAEACLEEKLDYRPDPKARCSRELLSHLIGHNLDIVELLDDGVIHHRNQVPFDSLADGIEQLDASFAAAIERLGEADEASWAEPAEFRFGEQLIMEAPRRDLAWLLFLDSIHHRGQLSTHLRPMGSAVPAIYGPSADDAGEGH